jgi:hypothetical protein
LELPSLRYVLEKRIELRGAGQGEWLAYLRELERIAADSGKPLAPNVEEILNKADAPAVATTSGAAR